MIPVGGEAGEGSDLDFLIRLDRDRPLVDRIALMQDLETFSVAELTW